MEVLEKEKVNGKEVSNSGTEMTPNDAYLLNKAVESLIEACPTMNIKTAQNLFESKANLENLIFEYDKKQQEILKKYVKIGKDGKLMTKAGSGGKQEWDYKRKKDKELAEKEMNKMFEGKKVYVDLMPITRGAFDSMNIMPFVPTKMFIPGQEQKREVVQVHFIITLFEKYLIL